MGLGELLHLFSAAFPPPTAPPADRDDPGRARAAPAAVRPRRALVAEVVRTTNDAYVGRVSLVRVFSGTMRPDTVVHVSGHLAGFAGHEVEGHGDHDEDERIGLLSSPLGDALRPKPEALAGDLCVVAKLSRAETTDTLSSKDSPAVVEPWVLPDPLLPVAIRAATKSDEDKLAGALQRLVAEDPTCGWSTTPRPTRSCSGRWARPTSTSAGPAARALRRDGRARAAAGAAA